jgi:3-hydroxyacyl-CoA dehydrogenase/enoyl-CoA hydratase/3-hydroxybutyryl-CoA epimerase
MADYNNFTVETDSDGIALVTWDMPGRSMNVFTEEVMEELDRIVDHVATTEAIKGAVVTSGKDSFSGGADLTMLQRMLGLYADESAKDEGKAVQLLFDNVGRMTGSRLRLGHCTNLSLG